MLLADSYGARLLVAVGTHYSLVEFLDKGREGMASTFLTRLRVGSKLVDAKGVSRIYRSQVKGWHLALLVLSGVVALVTALATTALFVGSIYTPWAVAWGAPPVGLALVAWLWPRHRTAEARAKRRVGQPKEEPA